MDKTNNSFHCRLVLLFCFYCFSFYCIDPIRLDLSPKSSMNRGIFCHETRRFRRLISCDWQPYLFSCNLEPLFKRNEDSRSILVALHRIFSSPPFERGEDPGNEVKATANFKVIPIKELKHSPKLLQVLCSYKLEQVITKHFHVLPQWNCQEKNYMC